MLEANESIHQRVTNTNYIDTRTHIMIGIEACDLIEFIQRKSFIALLIPIDNVSSNQTDTHTLTFSLKISFSAKI